MTKELPSLFADLDLPYGLHVLPDGDGRFVVLLGRDTEGPAAMTTVGPEKLQEIAGICDGLFAAQYRMDKVVATDNFLRVYGRLDGYTDAEIAQRLFSGEYDGMTAEEFRRRFPRRARV